jgi:hypothetical protein
MKLITSSLLLIEHINLNVMSRPVAEAMYLRGLGCSLARGREGKSLHSNVGPLCQFHTSCPQDESYIADEGPQVSK